MLMSLNLLHEQIISLSNRLQSQIFSFIFVYNVKDFLVLFPLNSECVFKLKGNLYIDENVNNNEFFQQKFFDSGDYQMAKQKSAAKPKPTGVLPTGDAIPTPETVPQRKTSIIQQQKFNTSTSTS